MDKEAVTIRAFNNMSAKRRNGGVMEPKKATKAPVKPKKTEDK